jgi:hypothetical protein
MARLISYRSALAVDGITPRATGRASQSLEDFLEAIAKLVPVEIIAVYMLVKGLSPSGDGLPPVLEIAIYGALVGLTVAYLNRFGGSVPNKNVQVMMGTISFVVWSYAIGGTFFWPALEHLVNAKLVYPSLGGIVALLWSLVTGLLNPGVGTRASPERDPGQRH